MTFIESAIALLAILFSRQKYIALATKHLGPNSDPAELAQMESEAAIHRSIFLRAAKLATKWTIAAGAVAILGLLVCGRLHAGALDAAKCLACFGAALAGIATWFALATPEDTWDVSERLDTKLRGVFFKALFFPGIAIAFMGSGW